VPSSVKLEFPYGVRNFAGLTDKELGISKALFKDYEFP